MNNKVVILSDKIKLSKKSKEYENDTFQQVMQVNKALKESGFIPFNMEFNLDLKKIEKKLKNINPDFVFNLVEEEDLITIAPLILENLGIKYTGCKSDTIHLTNDKVSFKNYFPKLFFPFKNIKTPGFISYENKSSFSKNKKYIIKAEKYHSSFGISEDSIKTFKSLDELLKCLNEMKKEHGINFFAEEFIDGREFNVSILKGEVMPVAEMKFVDYPKDKPHIVCYKAKWDEKAFEYTNTVRTFNFTAKDKKLINELKNIALTCSKVFNNLPYARIDFMVNKKNIPYILEINANPCLNKDAGFFAACQKKGLNFNGMIKKIIEAI